MIGAEPSPVLDRLNNPYCVQPFKPFADGLIKQGHTHAAEPQGSFEMVFVLAHRHRDLTRVRLAQAWKHTKIGGTIVVSGNKTDGIDACLRELRAVLKLSDPMPKAHGKVFWAERTEAEPEIFSRWIALAEASKNTAGFYTAAGMFSADDADPGSVLLAQYLPTQATGRIADLGAGWGYLAAQLLSKATDITQIELFEADWFALNAARLNIKDDRAQFHWADVSNLERHDKSFDLVVSNPPFHKGRKAEPDLGKSFITTAARILKPKGRFLMVANRHLPYEKTLVSAFKKLETLQESGGFKVISASIPQGLR